MNKGLSLVELLVAMACSGVLMLAIYHVHLVSTASSASVKGEWYCMQSLRQASLRLSMDLTQCACLMPQDLKVLVDGSRLYIAGIPVTSSHPGIRVSGGSPPPYYSLVLSSSVRSVVLDTVDIDGDMRPDYWAGLGMISDASACTIGQAYQRGRTTIPVTLGTAPGQGTGSSRPYAMSSGRTAFTGTARSLRKPWCPSRRRFPAGSASSP